MSQRNAPAIWFPTVRAGSGADVYTTRLVRALNRRGLRAEIFWLPHRAEYGPWTIAKPRAPSWANVVHFNSWLPARFVPDGLPTVVTVHHLVHDPAFAPYQSRTQSVYHRLLIRPRELRAIMRADTVTTVSSYVAETVHAFSGRRPDRVVANWVDIGRYAPASITREHGRPFTLLLSGNHSRRKGLDLLPALIEALGPGFEVRCTGGLRNSQTGSLPNVVFLGRLNEQALITEYQTCDVVLSLSRYEGFGLTAVEAMACGKPFVGFSTSGLAEVVNGKSGMLVPVDDIGALAVCMHKLQQHPALAKKMGNAGRTTAVSRYSEDNVDAYIDLYADLAEQS